VPRHVARLITRLVAPLVVDYFTYAARLGASACRAARHTARRRLPASGRFGTPHGLSRDSSLTSSSRAGSLLTILTTPRIRVPRHIARLVMRLVVDYFDYAACPGASACRAAHHATRHAACRRLLRLRRVSGCLGTLSGSSRVSSSTTSPTPCIRSLRHVARLVA
jgi:hypothetical protein